MKPILFTTILLIATLCAGCSGTGNETTREFGQINAVVAAPESIYQYAPFNQLSEFAPAATSGEACAQLRTVNITLKPTNGLGDNINIRD